MVMFVYRDEYYLERNSGADRTARNAAAGKAELLAAKQRHGPTGVAQLGSMAPRQNLVTIQTKPKARRHDRERMGRPRQNSSIWNERVVATRSTTTPGVCSGSHTWDPDVQR